jgi:hypothetical protein
MTTPTVSTAIPTLSAADLRARATQRRAVEALIWGIPAVNFDLMFQSFVRDAKGGESAAPRRLQMSPNGWRWSIAVVRFWTSTFHWAETAQRGSKSEAARRSKCF